MKLFRAMLLACWSAFVPTHAFALTFDNGSGNELLAICEQKSGPPQTFCIGYITGVVGAIPACIPTNATKGQARDIILKYLRENPQDRNLPAPLLIVAAIQEAYACSSNAWNEYVRVLLKAYN